MAGAYYPSVIASEGKLKGKWYWEVRLLDKDSNINGGIGLVNENASTNGSVWLGRGRNEVLYRVHENDIWYNRASREPSTFSRHMEKGDILGYCLDLDSGRFSLTLNGEKSEEYDIMIEEYEILRPVFGKIAKRETLSFNININFGVEPFKHLTSDLKDEGYLPYDIDNAHHENMNYELNKYLFESNGDLFQPTKDGVVDIGLKYANITQEQFEKYGTKNINLVQKHLDDKYKIICLSDRCQLRKQKLIIKGKKDLITTTNKETKILALVDKAKEEEVKRDFTITGRKDMRTVGCEVNNILVQIDAEREDVPMAKVKGFSSPQLVLPTKDIVLNKVKEIDNFTIKANDPNALIRIVYSIDSGETWLTKSEACGDSNYATRNQYGTISAPIDINNLSEVREYGLTIEEFNSIKNEWTAEILASGKIRFGYYLEIEDANTISEVDDLTVTLSMYGMWRVLDNGRDYRYEYTNEELTVRLFEDGTYKVNYHK